MPGLPVRPPQQVLDRPCTLGPSIERARRPTCLRFVLLRLPKPPPFGTQYQTYYCVPDLFPTWACNLPEKDPCLRGLSRNHMPLWAAGRIPSVLQCRVGEGSEEISQDIAAQRRMGVERRRRRSSSRRRESITKKDPPNVPDTDPNHGWMRRRKR